MNTKFIFFSDATNFPVPQENDLIGIISIQTKNNILPSIPVFDCDIGYPKNKKYIKEIYFESEPTISITNTNLVNACLSKNLENIYPFVKNKQIKIRFYNFDPCKIKNIFLKNYEDFISLNFFKNIKSLSVSEISKEKFPIFYNSLFELKHIKTLSVNYWEFLEETENIKNLLIFISKLEFFSIGTLYEGFDFKTNSFLPCNQGKTVNYNHIFYHFKNLLSLEITDYKTNNHCVLFPENLKKLSLGNITSKFILP